MTARSSWSWSSDCERAVLLACRAGRRRRRRRRAARPRLRPTWSSTSWAQAELVERRDRAVEDDGRAGALGVLLVAVERRREDRREQQQPEHDARVARGERPAAVDDLIRPARDRPFGQRREREAEPGPDQELRRDRPAPAGVRQERQRRRARPRRARSRSPPAWCAAPSGAGMSRCTAIAATGSTVTTIPAAAGDIPQPFTSRSTSRNSAATSPPERSSSAAFAPSVRPAGRRGQRPRDHAPDGRQRQQRERHLHEEDRPPAERLGQDPADRRPERRTEHARCRPRRAPLFAVARRSSR